MEDFAIPEEYYTCPADSLFDLLADSLLTFAKRLGWWGSRVPQHRASVMACIQAVPKLSRTTSQHASAWRPHGACIPRPSGQQ